jgi:hypothetical protein
MDFRGLRRRKDQPAKGDQHTMVARLGKSRQRQCIAQIGRAVEIGSMGGPLGSGENDRLAAIMEQIGVIGRFLHRIRAMGPTTPATSGSRQARPIASATRAKSAKPIASLNPA